MSSLSESVRLDGRVGLVVGGAGHVGRTAAACLLELGAHVILSDREEEDCRVAAEAIATGPVDIIAANLGDAEDTTRLAREAVDCRGRVDVLVHCAGYVASSDAITGWGVPFSEQSTEVWNQAMTVNLGSAFSLARDLAVPLGSNGNGSILLFGSIYGLVGPDMGLYDGTSMQNPVAYGASKGGLVQLNRYLAALLAPSVRVNMISPGGIKRGQPEAFLERYEGRIPMGRMATEDDLRGAIAYLVSDLSAYVTGHNLVVDGGWTAI